MKKSRGTKKDIYEGITNNIITALDKGTIPWHKPWIGGSPANYTSDKAYRGINVLQLEVAQLGAGYESNHWLTFKQAKNAGGSVKAGEKGTPIIFWKFFTKETKDEVSGEMVKESIPMARGYTVFNTLQCSGIKAKEKPGGVIDSIEAAECLVSGFGGPPGITHAGGRAFYSPGSDSVTMPVRNSFDSSESYYSTLFHELTHSTGHATRLDRNLKNKFGDDKYSNEELIAELGAAFLMGLTGGELIAKTLDNSAAYIAHWRSKLSEDSGLIVKASSAAQKAADYITKG